MSERWAIHIDIEGFSAKWGDTMAAFEGINALMQGIYWIGSRAFPRPPDRLFAHQFGDAFLVVSDYHEERLDRAVLIAIALLRHVLACGAVAKATIAEGELADISACYPPEIRSQLHADHIGCGDGLMTVSRVMGTALIRTVELDKKSPSGPLLTLHTQNRERIPSGIPVADAGAGVIALDWLHAEPAGLSEILLASGLASHSQVDRVAQLRAYVSCNPGVSKCWKQGCERFLGIGVA